VQSRAERCTGRKARASRGTGRNAASRAPLAVLARSSQFRALGAFSPIETHLTPPVGAETPRSATEAPMPPACANVPVKCEGMGQSACDATPGCDWGWACTGGPVLCEDAPDCSSCNFVPGCTCHGLDTCSGTTTADCSALGGLGSDKCLAWGCALVTQCWSAPVSCSNLSLTECAKTAGCMVNPMTSHPFGVLPNCRLPCSIPRW